MSVKKKIGIFARLSRILMAVDEGIILIQPEEVVITDRTKGGKVERKATDGTLTPIEDGTYELPDGYRFTVVGGFITEVSDADNATTEEGKEPEKKEGGEAPKETKAADEGTPPADAGASAPPVPGLDELTQRVAALETLVAEIKAMLMEANAELAKDVEANNKAEAAYTAMQSELVELAKEVKTFNESVPAGQSRTNPNMKKEQEKANQDKRSATATTLSKVMQRNEKKD